MPVDDRIQVVAVIATAALLLAVLELVRSRRLLERYALLWLISTVALLVLAVWQDLLEELASLLGFEVPANALFIAALGFVVLLLLHFSVIISRLSTESKVLAQEVARLDQQLNAAGEGGESRAPIAEGAESQRPNASSSARTPDQ
jgi:hypothetical protein